MEYLDDPNVPEVVKKQLRKVSETPEQEPGKKPEELATPPAEQPETIIPEQKEQPGESKVVEKEVVDNPETDIPKDDTPSEPEKDIDYKQKYLTLQGKYDAEVPRMTKALKSKDDVIDFYKRENQTLREQAQNSQVPQNPEKIELSPETMQQLEAAGYNDPEDVELIRHIMGNETSQLRQQLAANRNTPQQFTGSGCDGILLNNGFVDSRTMQSQPSYEYAMHQYGEFGMPASELYRQAEKRGDFDSAARILADVQSCMINDGLWQGQHPAMNMQEHPPVNPAGEQPPKVPAQKAKSVLPHNKTTTPAPKPIPLNADVIHKASLDLQKGKISYTEFEKIQEKFNEQCRMKE